MTERKGSRPLTFTQREILEIALEYERVTGENIPQQVLASETDLSWKGIHAQVKKIFEKGFHPPIARREVAQAKINSEIAQEVKIAKKNPGYLNNFIGNLPFGFYRPHFDLLSDSQLDEKTDKYDGRTIKRFLTDIDYAVWRSEVSIYKIRELQERFRETEIGSKEQEDARRQLTLLSLPAYVILRKKGYSKQTLIR